MACLLAVNEIRRHWSVTTMRSRARRCSYHFSPILCLRICPSKNRTKTGSDRYPGKVKKKWEKKDIPKVKQQQHRDLCWQELSGLRIRGGGGGAVSTLPETHLPWRPASWDPGSPAAGTAPGSPPFAPPRLPARRRLNLWPRLIGKAKN